MSRITVKISIEILMPSYGKKDNCFPFFIQPKNSPTCVTLVILKSEAEPILNAAILILKNAKLNKIKGL